MGMSLYKRTRTAASSVLQFLLRKGLTLLAIAEAQWPSCRILADSVHGLLQLLLPPTAGTGGTVNQINCWKVLRVSVTYSAVTVMEQSGAGSFHS